jgi:hypothetical protein
MGAAAAPDSVPFSAFSIFTSPTPVCSAASAACTLPPDRLQLSIFMDKIEYLDALRTSFVLK